MRLDGRRESSNVDDRRRAGGGTIAGVGLGGIVIVGLLTLLMGGNLGDVFNNVVQTTMQQGSVTSGGTGGDYAPTIAKRTVKTVQTARDGETIVISGLMRADTTTVERRVPLLGSIPLLGWLFRWDTEVEQRTSILVFVTPTILDGEGSPAALRESLEARTGLAATNLVEELSADGGGESAP